MLITHRAQTVIERTSIRGTQVIPVQPRKQLTAAKLPRGVTGTLVGD